MVAKAMEIFQKDVDKRGGYTLWQRDFNSFTGPNQSEVLASLYDCIIYAQTKYDYLQEIWVMLEHKPTLSISNFLKFSSCYFTENHGGYVHTDMRVKPYQFFSFMNKLRLSVEISKVFQEAPDHRFFAILNHEEIGLFKDDEEKKVERILEKLREAHLGKIVPAICYIPKPIYHIL